MKKLSAILLSAIIAVSMAACNDNEGGDPEANTLEELEMTSQWVNYSVATASELRDDCVALWAAWNGPAGISTEDMTLLGGNFFSSHPGLGANGYATIIKTAGQAGNTTFTSQAEAIRTLLKDGCANIATEVGSAKIGDPNGYAKAGDKTTAVLSVESWYSWNSITDYSDNIISIKNTYCGRRGAIDAAVNTNSISAYVNSVNPTLNNEVLNAIDDAYYAIKGMTAPFRNNLTGSKVDAAINACTDLAEILELRVYPLFASTSYDFTEVLRVYADEVVVPTYKDMKERAWALYNAVYAFSQDQSSQAKLDAACEAWRANRVPWEQSEAILFGPANESMLGLDGSMDSWPLDQNDIEGIMRNSSLSTVNQYIGAIANENVRGFHTIELLLFKDGQNRKVK